MSPVGVHLLMLPVLARYLWAPVSLFGIRTVQVVRPLLQPPATLSVQWEGLALAFDLVALLFVAIDVGDRSVAVPLASLPVQKDGPRAALNLLGCLFARVVVHRLIVSLPAR
jgi:hypothetical protein